MLEILLLGRPTFRVNGRPIALRDRKGIGLIAYLCANRTTSRDKLADLLWSDMSQADARRNLRQRLYELKDRLPEGFFAADGDIIRLGVNADIDLARFQAHLSAQEDEPASTLWRGRFLEDLDIPGADGFQQWLEATRGALTGSYHEALRRLAVKHENHGDLRGALEAHRRLLGDDELQEFHQREVIRLLEALGERENALLHYERYRQTLETELGDVPLPQTQQIAERVQNAIQRKASDLTVLEAPDAAQLDLRSPLVGREAEWAQLERAKPGLCLIIGEPGIGKTRLADELAYYTARKGVVHRLQGREGSSGSPLYPVAESLREALREPDWVQSLEPVWRTECARLVPEIDPSATPQPMPSLEGRVRFIEGLARALIASVGEADTSTGGVIVLDDLHWFDAATLELVAHLARRARDANVRLIATARTVELEGNEAAAPILADLKRDGLLTRLDLEPLQERDVRALIQSLSGGADAPAFAKRLHTATVGNPFFLLETLRDLFGSGQLHVTADGTWTTPHDDGTESYAELPIPATVRETVIARVDRTGADARRLLEAASLAGDGFDLALISSATALTEWEGVEAIERAVRAELLEEANDGYRFNHDLIRRALEDGLNPDRKKLIHRKLAVTLESVNGSSVQIAGHYEQGGQPERAVKWRVKAGEDATRLYAYGQALEHYKIALKGEVDDEQAFGIHRAMTQVFRTIDYRKDAAKSIDEMLLHAKRLRNRDLEVQAEIFLADTVFYDGNPIESLKILDRAILHLDTSKKTMTQAYLAYATISLHLGNRDKAELKYKEIISMRESCDSSTLAVAYIGLSDIQYSSGYFRESEENCAVARSLFENINDVLGLSRVFYLNSLLEDVKQNYVKSLQLCVEAKRLAKTAKSIYIIQSTSLQIAKLSFLTGNIDGARNAILNEPLFHTEKRSPHVDVYYSQCLARILHIDGKAIEAIDLIQNSITLGEKVGMINSKITGLLLLMDIFGDLKDSKNFIQNARELQNLISLGIGSHYKSLFELTYNKHANLSHFDPIQLV